MWTPFASATEWSESARGARGDAALGRLKTGVSLAQAEADLRPLRPDSPPHIRSTRELAWR